MISLADRYAFFREHAGYVVGRAAECAMALARAEVWAEEHGVTFRWEEDCDGDPPAEGNEMLWCAAVDADGVVLASVGGVEIRPGRGARAFGRVIEAELASEARDVADEADTIVARVMAERATYAGVGAP